MRWWSSLSIICYDIQITSNQYEFEESPAPRTWAKHLEILGWKRNPKYATTMIHSINSEKRSWAHWQINIPKIKIQKNHNCEAKLKRSSRHHTDTHSAQANEGEKSERRNWNGIEIMAYVVWRVFMKKYSKVRMGLHRGPVNDDVSVRAFVH